MLYSAGDIVRVRDDLEVDSSYPMANGEDNICFVGTMAAYRGDPVVIRETISKSEIDDFRWHVGYLIETVDGEKIDCIWTDDMFSGIVGYHVELKENNSEDNDLPDAEELSALYDWA